MTCTKRKSVGDAGHCVVLSFHYWLCIMQFEGNEDDEETGTLATLNKDFIRLSKNKFEVFLNKATIQPELTQKHL